MRKELLIIMLLLLSFSLSFGAGFGLYEFGARASTLGGAVVAQAYDASSVFYNPAGIVYLKGTQFYGGVTIITASNKWVGPAPLYSDEVFTSESQIHTPIGVYLTHRLSEKFAVGLGVTNPFGLGLKWSDDFPGRVVSKDVDLKSFYFSPVIAYQVTPGLSIGGGVDIVYSTVSLTRNILFPEDSHPGTEVGELTLSGNSKVSFGFSASILYKMEKLSLGFLYRHSVKNEFDGDADFTIYDKYYKTFLEQTAGIVDQKGGTEITYPAFLSVGAHYMITDRLGLEFDYMWTKWDVFDKLVISFDNEDLNTTVREEYSNSSTFRLGLHYDLTDKLEFRAGYIYDQTPQPRESMSPLLPDNTRNDYTLGLGYNLGKVQLDFGYMLVDFGERSTVVNGEGKHFDDFNGTYTGLAHLFMFSFGYSF